MTFSQAQTKERGQPYLDGGVGALDLDVTPAGRVPAADGKVAGQVLFSNCFALDGYHLGLCEESTSFHGISFKSLLASACSHYMTTESSDLEPDILSSSRDGRDLKGGVAVLGRQFTGIDVVLRGQLGLNAYPHPIGWAPVRIGDLDLQGETTECDSHVNGCKQP